MKTHSRQIVMQILMILILGITACGSAAPETQPSAVEPAELVTLRLALLPILDGLPVYVAQEQGYFEANGVKVEIIPVASGPERDQVIVAGQADGMINEIGSALLYNKQEIQVQILRLARIAAPEYPIFRILAAADSGITTPQELKNIPIGISEGTIIEYTTDRLLTAEGLALDDIEKVAVPKIPDRLALLASGELKAANLPDPAASVAILNGATLILDDASYPEYSVTVYSFRKAVIDEQPQALTGFMAALEQAVADINAKPNGWNEMLAERKLLPPPLIGKYQLPKYPLSGVPTEDQFADVVNWSREKGLVDKDYVYSESVNVGFLP